MGRSVVAFDRLYLFSLFIYDKWVKLLISVFLMCIHSFSVEAEDFKIDLSAIGNTKIISAKSDDGAEGRLVSKTTFNPKLKITYSLTPSFKLSASHTQLNYQFDNTQEIIADETVFSFGESELGLTWILFSVSAFRFTYTSGQEMGFILNESNQALIFQEEITYSSLFYDQILWLGEGYYFGFSVGLDLSTSSETLEDRSASLFKAFASWGSLSAFYQIKNTTKDGGPLSYEDKDTSFALTYALSF